MDLNLHLELSRSEDLLKKLVDKGTRQEGARAFVRVTCGAHQHEGVPLKIQSLQGEDHLALYQHEGGLRGQEALVILPLRGIGSVTLLNMRDHMELLTCKGPWSVDVRNAPSSLHVRRRWLALEDAVGRPKQMLHIELSPQQTQEPAVQVQLMSLIDSLQPAILALQSQPAGLAAWNELDLVTVQFDDAATLSVCLPAPQELRITIGYGMDASALSQLAAALQQSIENGVRSHDEDA